MEGYLIAYFGFSKDNSTPLDDASSSLHVMDSIANAPPQVMHFRVESGALKYGENENSKHCGEITLAGRKIHIQKRSGIYAKTHCFRLYTNPLEAMNGAYPSAHTSPLSKFYDFIAPSKSKLNEWCTGIQNYHTKISTPMVQHEKDMTLLYGILENLLISKAATPSYTSQSARRFSRRTQNPMFSLHQQRSRSIPTEDNNPETTLKDNCLWWKFPVVRRSSIA